MAQTEYRTTIAASRPAPSFEVIRRSATGARPIKAALTTPDREKVQSAHDKLHEVLMRSAAASDPLTTEEWQKLADAEMLLHEALGESKTTPTAIYARRNLMAKLNLHGGRR